MTTDDFNFHFDAKMTRITEREMLASLRTFAELCDGRSFTTRQYNSWKDRVCHSWTISERFGNWRRALGRVGIETGVKSRRFSSRELMDNLELAWRELGRPPGARLIAQHGFRISGPTYRRRWGSLQNACTLLARFKKGEITERQLLGTTPSQQRQTRTALSLKVRWDVLKRDNYRCVRCGKRPPDVVLEVDHKVSVKCGGTNDISNLRTLCWPCNHGKGER